MITSLNEYKLWKLNESVDTSIENFKHLITWWGATGYLYYNSLKSGPANITDRGKKMLKTIYDSIVNYTYNDYMNRKLYTDNIYDNPVWCDENVWSEMTKEYVDNVFKANMIKLNKPTLVSKSHDEDKIGFNRGWYSFSLGTIKKIQFGDLHTEYMLPKGFMVVDTLGLADKDEILIWGKDLSNIQPLKHGNINTI